MVELVLFLNFILCILIITYRFSKKRSIGIPVYVRPQSYKVIRSILWFAREDVVEEDRLLKYYSQNGINDLLKYGYLEKTYTLKDFIIDGALRTENK